METKCLVVDDEPLARDLIRNHLEKLENFEIVAECSDAMKALNALRIKDVDLIFMDIQMPQITGVEFLKTLKNPPKVIFTTAHREYAIDGFELDVVDFLLKPITLERFLKAVNKYFQLTQEETNSNNLANTSVYQNEESFIYVKENKKVVKVYLKEILYIEGLSEYVQIHTENRKLVTKTSMSNMEEKLPEAGFMRIHKSFIVSLRKIEAFSSSTIDVPGKELPIGRSYKTTVLDSLHAAGTLTAS